MEKFRELIEAKDSVKHNGYTIAYHDGDCVYGYLFVSKGKEFFGSIDLSIGQEGIKEDIRELTRSSDDKINSDKNLQKLINKYAK